MTRFSGPDQIGKTCQKFVFAGASDNLPCPSVPWFLGGIPWSIEFKQGLSLLKTTFFLSAFSKVLPKGSKRCFPNGVFQILDLSLRRRQTLSEGQRLPENTSVFKHFGALCTCGSRPPSEHTTLKNTV